MNGIMKKILAVLLAVITASLVSVQVLGAAANKKYISDVVVCYASSSEEAEKALNAKGYQLADGTDLNSSLTKGTYLGYKTTDKKEEAITDLALMNMKGKYSYSDYETLLKNNREQVDTWIGNLITTVKEYRSNYEAGIVTTVQIHDFLNKITEDVSGLPMGDFLLECSIDGKHDELTDVFMKGNSSLISCIEQALLLACDTEDTTWIDRMGKSSYDKLEQRYLTAYKTANKAETAMSTDFGDKATAILSSWDQLYETLQTVENSLSVKDGKGEYDFSLQDVPEDTESDEDEVAVLEAVTDLDAVNDLAIYSKLSETEFEGSTLLEFFNRPSSEVEIYELYPMCDSLSDGQAAQLSMTDLRQMVLSALTDKNAAGKDDVADLGKYIAGMDEVSIYDGIDLDIFEKGVALTSEASERSSSSTDHWYNAFLNPYHNTSRWTAYVIFYIIPTVIMTAVYLSALTVSLNKFDEYMVTQGAKKMGNMLGKSCRLIFDHNPVDDFRLGEKVSYYMNSLMGYRLGDTPLTVFYKAASFILVLIFLAVDVIMLVETIKAQLKDLDYEDIPHHILDATDARGSVDYVMYKAVQTVDERAADLNAYESWKGWLVLYYTKDAEAGDPVLAGITVKNGKNSTPAGYSNVHMFGSRDAADVTAKIYTDKTDDLGGTFMFFKRASSAPLAGTVFSDGTYIIPACAAIVLGILAGVLSGKKKSKKSKAEEAV